MAACLLERPCLQRPVRTLEHNFSRLSSIQIGWNVYLPWSNLNGLLSKFLTHIVNLGSTENILGRVFFDLDEKNSDLHSRFW